MTDRAGPFRLYGRRAALVGSSLDRGRELRFHFDGEPFTGVAGDTLASALLANGVRIVGRSFKFHRPRGVYACGPEEPNALVQLGTGASAIPSARAPLVELHQGLEAFSCSGWPSRERDIGRLLDFTAPLWAAGFYNKTFIWPGWRLYEGILRRMTGFGHAPSGPDPARYDARNLHCEVLVIGGGPAGLRAALAAAQSCTRVVLADQADELGGRCSWDGSLIEGMPGITWARSAAARLRRNEEVRILLRTQAVGYYDGNIVVLVESPPAGEARVGAPRERCWTVRAERVVLATGAIEQPMVFANNDRPGILLAGAAHQYLRRYAVACGRRVLIATNNDSAYGLARALKHAMVEVVAVADTRHHVSVSVKKDMRLHAIPLTTGAIPVDTEGFGTLRAVTLGRLSADSRAITATQRYEVDALAVSGGWNPALHLYSQAGGTVAYSENSGAFEPLGEHRTVTLAGAVGGSSAAGSDAAVGSRVSPIGDTQRQWVDLRHDVTVADLELAHRENYACIEHLKRYTTLGMAADQGKTSSIVAVEVIARLRGVKASRLGHTTLRPPAVPVTLGTIAGRMLGERFAPTRRTPLHAWHEAHGALMEDFGEWKRPAAYLCAGESRLEAAAREARAVRTMAGLLDSCPLGKIEVQGPDALEFVDRFYINNLSSLKLGRARYGIMLRESGAIFDDGTVVMIGPDRVILTTTSARAAAVSTWLDEWHQGEWRALRVAILPVTDQWATVTIAGPRSREILARLNSNLDLSSLALPHLAVREGMVLGQPARIYRVSFSGELSYEINVPTTSCSRVWEALLVAGEPEGLAPCGLDALLSMRLEKGFLHVGTDTDGSTVPNDVGWGKVAAAKSAYFIGKRSLLLPENTRRDRLQLVGLISETEIVVGSHLRLPGSSEATDGWVTSAGRATSTHEPIALALLRGGRQQIDVTVRVHDAGAVTNARVVSPPFLDPAGDRMHG